MTPGISSLVDVIEVRQETMGLQIEPGPAFVLPVRGFRQAVHEVAVVVILFSNSRTF